jgi:hypothetical protein
MQGNYFQRTGKGVSSIVYLDHHNTRGLGRAEQDQVNTSSIIEHRSSLSWICLGIGNGISALCLGCSVSVLQSLFAPLVDLLEEGFENLLLAVSLLENFALLRCHLLQGLVYKP